MYVFVDLKRVLFLWRVRWGETFPVYASILSTFLKRKGRAKKKFSRYVTHTVYVDQMIIMVCTLYIYI